jgi:hypothetical protein
MKKLTPPAWLMALALSTLILEPSTVTAQGTAFIYQGRLNDNGSPAGGLYDFQFTVCDAATNGNRVAGPLTNSATTVANGLFTVTLDFGPVFNGANYWLEIAVRTNGGGGFTALNPCQPLAPAPYAIYAANAATAGAIIGPLPGGGLSGTYSGALALTNAGNQFGGSFAGNGSGLTNLSGGGNFIVIPAGSGTAAVQAALSLGTNVQLAPGTYTLANLTLANNTHLWGYGATIQFDSAASNFFIDEGTNVYGTMIEGLTFDGMSSADYAAGPPVLTDLPEENNGLDLYIQSLGVIRHGVRVNGGGGNKVVNCTFRGFNGVAIMLVSSNNGLSYILPSHAVITGNNCYYNETGIYVLGSSMDYPGWPYAPIGLEQGGTSAEYHVISGNYSYGNGIGIETGAGNINITGNILSGNYCSVYIQSGPNGGHGLVSANTINHSHYGVRCGSVFGKETIDNNLFWSTDYALYDDGAPWVEFANNCMSPGDNEGMWIVTNSTATEGMVVYFRDNAYFGQWGLTYTNLVNFGSGSGITYVYGNHSLDHGGDTDGSAASLIDIGTPAFTNTLTAGGFASGATNRGRIAATGWTNNTGANCVAYVSGLDIGITNIDGAGNAYMTNLGVTGTVTIFMQPGAKLRTSRATGFFHAE